MLDPARFVECSDTFRQLGGRVRNEPKEPATLAAMASLSSHLLEPVEAEFGPVTLTYGFAGYELQREVQARAIRENRTANITPSADQHAGHELGPWGRRINKRDGFAVDFHVPGRDPYLVAEWIVAHLPYDRIYLFGHDRPLHLAWAPEPAAYVVEQRPKNGPGTQPVLFRSGPLRGAGIAEALRRGVPFG